MERRDFIQRSVLATTALSAAGLNMANAATQQSKTLYEWRVYEMRFGQASIDNFLSKALIPALNRLGIKNVGAFSEIGKSEPLKIYLLIPYPSLEDFSRINKALHDDEQFAQAAASYNQLPAGQAAYARYDSSLMVAFDSVPELIVPQSEPRIFEVRSYEGYSEDAVRRKIKMFNVDELPVFTRLKLNPVFFGDVIVGPALPRLTYMLTFRNMEERDQAWKAFGSDPEWQRISKLPEYADTVSRIYKTFLEPLPYSQV